MLADLLRSQHVRAFRTFQDQTAPGWRRQWFEQLGAACPAWQVATVRVYEGDEQFDMVVLCRGGFEGERIEGFDPDGW